MWTIKMTFSNSKIAVAASLFFITTQIYADPPNPINNTTNNFTVQTVGPSTINGISGIAGIEEPLESSTTNTFQVGQISIQPIFDNTPIDPGMFSTTSVNGILSTSIITEGAPSILVGTLKYQGPLLMGQIAAGPSLVGRYLLASDSIYSVSGQIQTSDLMLNGVIGLGESGPISYGYQALTSNAWQVGVVNISGSASTLTVTPGTVAISGANLNMNNNRINGVAPGVAGTDAVNLNQLEHVSKKSYQGIASVAAISGIPALPADKQYNLGIGVGNYAGESSLAIGGNVRFNDNFYGKLGVGISGSNSAASAGVGVAF